MWQFEFEGAAHPLVINEPTHSTTTDYRSLISIHQRPPSFTFIGKSRATPYLLRVKRRGYGSAPNDNLRSPVLTRSRHPRPWRRMEHRSSTSCRVPGEAVAWRCTNLLAHSRAKQALQDVRSPEKRTGGTALKLQKRVSDQIRVGSLQRIHTLGFNVRHHSKESPQFPDRAIVGHMFQLTRHETESSRVIHGRPPRARPA